VEYFLESQRDQKGKKYVSKCYVKDVNEVDKVEEQNEFMPI
jgi:hypothetical protein